jgi:hypothetical protein
MKATSYLSGSRFQNSGNTANSASHSNVATSKFLNMASKFWRALTVVDVEPQIRQERDRNGKFQWRVFDPITSTSRFFDSENDVCVWLEQRYYA